MHVNGSMPWLDDVARAARRGRLGVLTDVDGTISYLAPRPDLARVDPRCRAALAALRPLAALVGVVSGRELDDVRALVGLDGLLYSGSHGLTWSYGGVDEIEEGAAVFAGLVETARAEMAPALLARRVLFEPKRFSLGVHYRDDPDPGSARAAIFGAINRSPAARAFAAREGARVVELVPPLHISKGTIIRRVVDRFRLGALLFFGDDVTDADAFTALRELRREGRITGTAVLAVHAETAAEARAAADAAVAAVTGVADTLERLVDRLTP